MEKDGIFMGGKTFRIATIFGFPIKLDLSWIFILALVTWTAAKGFFPYLVPGLPAAGYWIMGLAGALLLFCSILFHELSHSLVARTFKIPIRGITLFLFGGAAEMAEEPPTARSELYMAIAGPISSLVLAGACGLTLYLGQAALPAPVFGILFYLFMVNSMLALFNLIPGFPLDGGRILRAILWRSWGDLRRATRVASLIGAGFGILLIILGIATLLDISPWLAGGPLQVIAPLIAGGPLQGFWMILIGWFLRRAALSSYQQLLVRQTLHGLRAADLMTRQVITVNAGETLETLVNDYLFATGHNKFPVVENCRLVGVISIRDIRAVPKERWATTSVGAAMQPVGQHLTLAPADEAVQAFKIMATQDISQIPVELDGCLVGIISRRDLMQRLGIQLELEGNQAEETNLD